MQFPNSETSSAGSQDPESPAVEVDESEFPAVEMSEPESPDSEIQGRASLDTGTKDSGLPVSRVGRDEPGAELEKDPHEFQDEIYRRLLYWHRMTSEDYKSSGTRLKMVRSSLTSDKRRMQLRKECLSCYIDATWIREQFEEQDGKCHYCKCHMLGASWLPGVETVNRKQTKDAVTIERLDNSMPHEKSNCVLACIACNFISHGTISKTILVEIAAGLKSCEFGFCPDCKDAEDSDDEHSMGGIQPFSNFYRRGFGRPMSTASHCKEHANLRGYMRHVMVKAGR